MAVLETNETGAGLQRAIKEPHGVVEWIVTAPARAAQFLRETRLEMHKVVTPSKTEVRSTTTVVLVTVFMFAAYFELVDLVFGTGIDKLFKVLTKQ